MSHPHLDDVQLSADLDGLVLDEPGSAHLAGCSACSRRRGELAAAASAVAAPPAAVDPALVDVLVGRAAAQATAGAAQRAPLDMKRDRRRLVLPPRGWIVAAAAALAGLVGLTGLLQATSPGGDQSSATKLAGGPGGSPASSDDELAGGTSLDAERVTVDLGYHEDPAQLVAALVASAGLSRSSPTRRGVEADPPAGEAAPAREVDSAAESRPEAGEDRARCASEARRIGAGRLGGHLSTAALVWKGEPAEVLVFELAEPSHGPSRQALVMRRAGCGLLADPRF